MKRDLLNYDGVKVGEVELPDGATEEQWQEAFRKLFPPIESVASKIEKKLKQFDQDTTNYIYDHYPAPSQQSLVVEMVYAMFLNQTNKMAAIASIRDWAGIVLEYHFQKWEEIEACTTHSQIDAISWDLSQFNDLDPKVSLKQVLAMND